MNFNLIKTSIPLLLALIALPILTLYLDHQNPLSGDQVSTLKELFTIMIVLASFCFIVGESFNNNSQVDKLWSILPVFYCGLVLYRSGWDPRLCLMSALVLLWGIRLTYNFARKGAYSWRFWDGMEDYRWGVLRSQTLFQRPWAWRIFHLCFICFYQMTLILLFCLPILVAWQGATNPLSWIDYALSILFLGALIIETIADEQQWKFQREKKRFVDSGKALVKPYSPGFIHTGLWKYVRHPNYASEQMVWILFYMFSIAATGRWFNWSIAGSLLLLLLFQGSSNFSEKISAGKYPEYKAYQQKTGRFLPKWSNSSG